MTTTFIAIGVPYFLGQPDTVVSELHTIRDMLAAEYGINWLDVNPVISADENPVIAVNRAIGQAIVAHRDSTPLVFAPDCTSALGIMKGLETRAPDVLWLDAHGDFNTPETTRSGFLGGMPLAALVGRGNQDLMRGIGLSPISEGNVTLADARNLDPEEAELLRSSNVSHLPHLSEVMKANWEKKPLYLHLDTDVLDPADMPTNHYPETNGPSLEELIGVLHHVIRVSTLAGAYISLWDAVLPGAEIAQEATLRLIRTLVA